jgi:hypothetical protein
VIFRVFSFVLQVVWLNLAFAVKIAISSSIPSNMRWNCLCLKVSFSVGLLFCMLSLAWMLLFLRKVTLIFK